MNEHLKNELGLSILDFYHEVIVAAKQYNWKYTSKPMFYACTYLFCASSDRV